MLTHPENWQTIPVRGKRPYHRQWPSLSFSNFFLSQQLASGRATGIALVTGNGIVAIDCDGLAGLHWLQQHLGVVETVSFTSGREGRLQMLFSTDLDWPPVTLIHPEVCLRGKNSSSVLPPSMHPITHRPYVWIHTPEEWAIAPLPRQMVKFFRDKEPDYRSALQSNSSPFANTDSLVVYCLSVNNRRVLETGVAEGSRNDRCYALAMDILGVVRYLMMPVDSLQLLHEYGQRCFPPMDPREIVEIYRKALQKNPQPACLDISTRVENWHKKFAASL